MSGVLEDRAESRRQEDTGGQVAVHGPQRAHSNNKTHRLMCWRELLSEIPRPFILFLKLAKKPAQVFFSGIKALEHSK